MIQIAAVGGFSHDAFGSFASRRGLPEFGTLRCLAGQFRGLGPILCSAPYCSGEYGAGVKKVATLLPTIGSPSSAAILARTSCQSGS